VENFRANVLKFSQHTARRDCGGVGCIVSKALLISVDSSPTDLIGLSLHAAPILLLTLIYADHNANCTPLSPVIIIYQEFSLVFAVLLSKI